MTTVDELMTRDLVTLPEDADVLRIDDLLKLHHIRHLPIVRGDRLVGLVTHRDLLRAQARVRSSPGIRASEVMTREVQTIPPDTSVRYAIYKLLDDKVGCLPVVDAAGRLVGIFTESDAVRFAGRLLGEREQAAVTGGDGGLDAR